MEKKFELLPPIMPNFASLKREAGLKQDGLKMNNQIPISSFTKQEAEEYGELMYRTFMKHWESKQPKK